MTIYDITFKMLQVAYNVFPWFCYALMAASLAKPFIKGPTLVKVLNEGLGIGLILVIVMFVMSVLFSQTILAYTVTENTKELNGITQEVRMARRGIWQLVKKGEE